VAWNQVDTLNIAMGVPNEKSGSFLGFIASMILKEASTA
jgi:hypothetical protein